MLQGSLIKKIIYSVVFFSFVLAGAAARTEAAAMSDYCVTPPFIVGGVTPNLLLMIDNSASMYDLAYIAGTTGAALPTYSCGGTVGTTEMSYCLDNTYDNTYSYEGYFNKDKFYQYNESPANNSSTPDVSTDKFTEIATLPSPCIYGTGTNYLCVNATATSVTKFAASGRFLNWLSASKFDVEKKILTGGKYDSANQILKSESRGCLGKRFVKIVPGINLTFAIRGPNALEPDFANPGTQGGENRIEIYASVNSNMSDCQCAVANWTSGNFGQAQTLTNNCLNIGTSGAAGNELSTYNHSMQTCWQISDNIKNGATTEAGIWQGINLQDMKTACEHAYDDQWFGKGKPVSPPVDDIVNLFTSDISGNWICTGIAIHNAVSSPYDVLGNNTEGFLGNCVSSFDSAHANLGTIWSSDACIKEEIQHYCFGNQVAEVTDPSIGAADTSQTGNLPSVMMDSSVRSLGTPAGTFFARVAKSSAPTGLINTFESQIRFGAMTFNTNGSKTECNPGGLPESNIRCEAYCSATTTRPCSSSADCPGGETCNLITKTDGGKIISYIGDPIGNADHSTGLINMLDNIPASSWTPFAEAFYSSIGYYARPDLDYSAAPAMSRDFRLQTGDYLLDHNPSQKRCQRNNILLITDGSSTADMATAPNNLAAKYLQAGGVSGYDTTNKCPKFSGSRSLDDLAWIAKHKNIKTFDPLDAATSAAPSNASEYIDTYVVYSGPLTSDQPGQCDPKTLMDATAEAGGTTSALTASNPSLLEAKIREAFEKISAKTASGTAASVLASGEGSGANLIQALFYPKRRFNSTTDIQWTGVLQNLWYYIDPYLGGSSIREDTNTDKNLSLNLDYILQFSFANDETTANLFQDTNGDGSIEAPGPQNVLFSDIKSLWEAGKLLQKRAPGSTNGTVATPDGDRVIFTNVDDNNTIDAFDTGNATNLQPKLNVSNTTEAAKLIKYIRGIDDVDGDNSFGDADNNGIDDDAGDTIDGLVVRNRTVTFDGVTNTWKLGDIVNATPKIVSWVPLNVYDKIYLDNTYRDFINSDNYRKRGMVYAGVNDGMLHAFRLGLLGVYSDNPKASLGKACSTSTHIACRDAGDCPSPQTCQSDGTIGKELWSFIPKNALPYLKYFADPGYCHQYYIDATPYVVDASLNRDSTESVNVACTDGAVSPNGYWTCKKTKDSWMTVLIGGMRLGGACRDSSSNCKDCTKTPMAGTGYSTYFALNITDPNDPKLLWELSNEALGYSTSGPAIVRLGDSSQNGRWYVIFGSGPSGYVSSGQFLGITEHNNYTFGGTPPGGRGDLRLFVYDLKTGDPLTTINANDAYGDLYAAFAGNMVNGAIDFDQSNHSSTGFYQDDAVYFGFTRRADLGTTATAQGGDANHIQLSSSSAAAAEFYRGQFIHRNDGSHETKLITGYSGSGGTTPYNAKVDSNWEDPNPTSATQYNILSGWTVGGVMRLLTKEDMDPGHWVVSKVIDNIGPVTAAVTKLQNFKEKNLRLFFGTGRYYYKMGDDVLDDASSPRRLYGINEPCFSSSGINTACGTAALEGNLGNANSAAGSLDPDGWYIDLDKCMTKDNASVLCSDATATFGAERLMTDPLAITTGAVFFTTSSPTADVCEYGGQSHLWAVQYDTGGSLAGKGVLKGKAIVQVSTGSIKEVDLETAFTDKDGRRSDPIPGLPPSGGLSVVVPPKPSDKILHMRKQ